MSYLIPDRGVRSKRGVGLDTHYQSTHYHRKKVYPTVAACVNPLLLGTNILADPGGEFQISRHTGGPNGDEVPSFNSTGVVWGSDNTDC